MTAFWKSFGRLIVLFLFKLLDNENYTEKKKKNKKKKTK